MLVHRISQVMTTKSDLRAANTLRRENGGLYVTGDLESEDRRTKRRSKVKLDVHRVPLGSQLVDELQIRNRPSELRVNYLGKSLLNI